MFRDVVTTLLEVTGLASIAAGAGLAVAHWSTPGGLAVGGLCLIGSSVLIERPWHTDPATTPVAPEAFL